MPQNIHNGRAATRLAAHGPACNIITWMYRLLDITEAGQQVGIGLHPRTTAVRVTLKWQQLGRQDVIQQMQRVWSSAPLSKSLSWLSSSALRAAAAFCFSLFLWDFERACVSCVGSRDTHRFRASDSNGSDQEVNGGV